MSIPCFVTIESEAQLREKGQEPPCQSTTGANIRKEVKFSKVIKIIMIGDKVDEARFHLFHHFATRQRSLSL